MSKVFNNLQNFHNQIKRCMDDMAKSDSLDEYLKTDIETLTNFITEIMAFKVDEADKEYQYLFESCKSNFRTFTEAFFDKWELLQVDERRQAINPNMARVRAVITE